MSSSNLLRDLASSARSTTTIVHWRSDKNQNILDDAVYRHNESETRKMIADVITRFFYS